MRKPQDSDNFTITSSEFAFQNHEKKKKAKELLNINLELIFHNQEKEKREAELVIANKELAYQNKQKEKRAAELILANRELVFQNSEKEKRASELILANTELAFQNSEKEKRASELVITNFNLGEAKSNLKEHIQEIEEMMFITSHKVRQPIANILGLSDALELFAQSPEDLKESIRHIKKSALILEGYTKELTQYIEELKQNWKE